jgi:D-amino-acid dehydrogenase
VTTDVLVVGGGAIGLATAHALRRTGRSVTIVDRALLGSGAATGNAGEVCPTELSPLAAPGVLKVAVSNSYRRNSALYIQPRALPGLSRYLTHLLQSSTPEAFAAAVHALTEFAKPTMALFKQLEADGVTVGLRQAPYLNVYSSRAVAENRRNYKLKTYPGEFSEVVPGDELRRMEPVLSDAVQAGFLTHGQAHLDPNTYITSLCQWLRRNGVDVFEGTQVTAIKEHGDKVVLATSGGNLEAHQVVITAGVGTPEVARLAGMSLPIVPGKGYSFTISPDARVSHVIKLEEAYVALAPMNAGVRVAGTMEFDLNPSSFNRRRVNAIIQAAKPFINVDWDARTHEWVGPRPMTSDGLPIIDRLPGRRRVFVAAGHNMLGLLLSPVTADAVVELLDDRPPATIAPFRISRLPRWLARPVS